MDAKRLTDLLQGEDTQKLITGIINSKPPKKVACPKGNYTQEDFLKQYDPLQHDVYDTYKRKKKEITKEDGSTDLAEVVRFGMPLQKLIVSRAASFLAGNPIELECNAENEQAKGFLEVIHKVWEDCKLNYKIKRLAKLMMAETECAVIWYRDKVDGDFWADSIMQDSLLTLRMRIIAKSTGDDLYPVFDAMDDLIAFGRGHKQYDEEGNLVDCFDIYTKDRSYKYRKEKGTWISLPDESNFFSKMPIIYFSQDRPEWADVQDMISRYEEMACNLGDINDYNGSPIVLATGNIKGFATKGERGKVLQMAEGADAKYLTWDNAPESWKLEMTSLRSLIFDLTDTPDISMEQMSSLGTYSGIALKMLFLNAHLKAADKEEIFGESIQRLINFLKSGLVSIKPGLKGLEKLVINPKFEYYLPKNDVEKVDTLATAVQSKFLSIESAAEQSPTTTDVEVEKARLKKEQEITDQKINEDINQGQ
jgi:SPP1 family phage portal protein